MKGHNHAVQRQLLLVVLIIIVLLPIFLFVHGMVMNRQLAERISRSAVDQITREVERRKLQMMQKEDWDCFRFWWMSLGPSSGAPITEPSVRKPGTSGDGSLPKIGMVRVEGGVPGAAGERKPAVYMALADSREEMERMVFDIMRRGGKPFYITQVVNTSPAAPREGYVPVELVSQGVGDILTDFTRSNNSNLLTMSLAGTLLLLGLGAYIVVLSERGRKLESQLQREKGLAYVGTLAAGLAHEIRNPLSSVKMNVQMIEQKLSSLDSEQFAYLDTKVTRILQETTRLESSISDFLRFARPAPLRTAIESFNDVVDEAVDFLAPECARDGIEIVKHYADDLPPIGLDRAQFGQALRNLIINARQAMAGRGGRLEITTRRAGSSLEVTVADTGPGVPEDARGRLFEVFFTTKPDGTGLGLSIVKQIAEAHGGAARFDGRDGGGAAFTLSLPA